MEKTFISLNGLQKVLSPKEMKNITGGSGCTVVCSDNSQYGINCANTIDCEEQCWEKCGGGGWMTNCY